MAFMIYYLHELLEINKKFQKVKVSKIFHDINNEIHIGASICGKKEMAYSAMGLINSAIVMSHQSILNFHLFVQNDTKLELKKIVIKLNHLFPSFMYKNMRPIYK